VIKARVFRDAPKQPGRCVTQIVLKIINSKADYENCHYQIRYYRYDSNEIVRLTFGLNEINYAYIKKGHPSGKKPKNILGNPFISYKAHRCMQNT